MEHIRGYGVEASPRFNRRPVGCRVTLADAHKTTKKAKKKTHEAKSLQLKYVRDCAFGVPS